MIVEQILEADSDECIARAAEYMVKFYEPGRGNSCSGSYSYTISTDAENAQVWLQLAELKFKKEQLVRSYGMTGPTGPRYPYY